ncbi:hypothetical protein Q5752_002397 [Cryptotrichosporon argae]
MASPPDLLSGIDLIPHLGSGSATPTSPRHALSPAPASPAPPHARSRTAPLARSGRDASVPPPARALRSPRPRPAPLPSANAIAPNGFSPHASALRRSSSSLSAGAGAKKVLRFTPMAEARLVPRDQAEYLLSDPGTPNLSETADQIRRTLSLASLDSLVLLSDAAQRDRVLAGVSRAGKDLVWRPKHEKKVFPTDAERALLLALRRGLRSCILAFCVRAGINVLLVLFRRRLRWRVLRHAVFGAEPFRFGGMIGSFTLLNTLTLHLLRLAPPWSYVRRRMKAGLARPSFGPPEREGDEGERRWQAAVAGAVGSLGLLFETAGRRTGVAQQMFVRGLQATYNQLGFDMPHGELLVFGMCCGQIMFAWLLSPETMPKEYSQWIQGASQVPEHAIIANRTAVRHNLIAPDLVHEALQMMGVTRRNKALLEQMLVRLEQGWRPTYAPCEMVHPWVDSCTDTSFRRFFTVFRFMLPVYSALHIIPMLVLRRQHVARDPVRMLSRATWGITRSCSFLGAFVVICQSIFCFRSQTMAKHGDVFPLRRKETFWAMGFVTCLSLLVEEKKRRAELAMYVLPRALESAWSGARRKAWVPLVPFGESILGAIAMAMVMDAYKHSPESLSNVVRKLLYQLVGPV